jgi:putative addiction module component (TIGR02574 family)
MTESRTSLTAELRRLSASERLQLVEDLWDTIAADSDALPALTPDQLAEIERRLAAHDADPSSAVPWEEVRSRLWLRLK